MTTAAQVLSAALKQLLVEAEDAPLESDDYADAMFAMNNWVAELAAAGTELGYTPVTNVADVITVPAGAILGIISNVAVVIAPIYGQQVSPALGVSAERGVRTLQKIGRKKVQMSMPTTLPTGSGNQYAAGSSTDYNFFGATVAAILSMVGNTFTSTPSAAATPTLIVGHWRQDHVVNMVSDITGRIRSTFNGQASMTPLVTLSATGTGACTFHIFKNGVSITSTAATLSTTAVDVILTTSTTLESGDELTLMVAVDAGTEPVTVVSGRIEAT